MRQARFGREAIRVPRAGRPPPAAGALVAGGGAEGNRVHRGPWGASRQWTCRRRRWTGT